MVKAVQEKNYGALYRPEAGWLFVTKFSVLEELFTLGVIFYDPYMYGVLIEIPKVINFEITYTKVTDEIGKWYVNLEVPDELRTIEAGAFSFTVPTVSISIYTNGNWRVDIGFPWWDIDDWSRSFKVQAQAGPVPIIGWGGFYLEV